MKKLVLALMAIAATLLGFGLVVQAYPPGAGLVTSTPSTLEPGAVFTVNATCRPGETVTFVFLTQTGTDVCSGATTAGFAGSQLTSPQTGTASTTFVAPMEPGTYSGTVVGSETGDLGPFSVTVRVQATPQAPLPSTGSSSTATMTIIAVGLFAIGAGLFGVARARRPYFT